MSDTVLKLIPTDKRHIPPSATHQPALDILLRLAPNCECPRIAIYEQLQYIDAGENEEGATCPHCGQHMVFDSLLEDDAERDWFRNIVHQTEDEVIDGATTVAPCCGVAVLFENVRFDYSGFAMFELSIDNPDVDYPLSDEAMQQVANVLGCSLRQIWARY